MTAVLRVAVIGGDDRIHRQAWPPGYVVSTYTASEPGKLIVAWRAGAVDKVVVLTRWIGHSIYATLRRTIPAIVPWTRGIPQLAAELPRILPLSSAAASTSSAPGNGHANGNGVAHAQAESAWSTWSRVVLDSTRREGWRLPDLLTVLGVEPGDPEEAAIASVIERACRQGDLYRDGDCYFPTAPLPEPEPEPAAEEPQPEMTVACATEKKEPAMPETVSSVSVPAPAADKPAVSRTAPPSLDDVPRYLPRALRWEARDQEALVKAAVQHTKAEGLLIDLWLATDRWHTPGAIAARLRYGGLSADPRLVSSLDHMRTAVSAAAAAQLVTERHALRAGTLYDYVSKPVAVEYVGGKVSRLDGLPTLVDRTTSVIVYAKTDLHKLHEHLTLAGSRPMPTGYAGSTRPRADVERSILDLLRSCPGATTTALRDSTKVSVDYAKVVIADLVAAGRIVEHPGKDLRCKRYALPGVEVAPVIWPTPVRRATLEVLPGQAALPGVPVVAAAGSSTVAPVTTPATGVVEFKAPIPTPILTGVGGAPAAGLRSEIFRAIEAGELSLEKGLAMLKALLA